MSAPFVVPNDLPATRRIVTGHNDEGKAIFVSDESFNTDPVGPSGRLGFKALYETEKTPANNDNPFKDPMFNALSDIGNKEGTILRVADMAPKGEKAFMHRTETVDYAIVLHGEVTAVLDSGEETVIRAGDILIQRGVTHGWINKGESWCRIIFVSIASHPAKVGDKVLGAEGYDPKMLATPGHQA
ncbi:hypothetical protein BT69DRAFT_1331089 [Atractiella rhizophila]|nr:hypothetical protein BT69DRAFT_1331089 [Atractiella rhizophila]